MPEEVNKVDSHEIIDIRRATHGHFPENARIAQHLKDFFRRQISWEKLPLFQREALDLIALKLSRILSGKGSFQDHWDDIAGYAILANGPTEEEEKDGRESYQEAIKTIKFRTVAAVEEEKDGMISLREKFFDKLCNLYWQDKGGTPGPSAYLSVMHEEGSLEEIEAAIRRLEEEKFQRRLRPESPQIRT